MTSVNGSWPWLPVAIFCAIVPVSTILPYVMGKLRSRRQHAECLAGVGDQLLDTDKAGRLVDLLLPEREHESAQDEDRRHGQDEDLVAPQGAVELRGVHDTLKLPVWRSRHHPRRPSDRWPFG